MTMTLANPSIAESSPKPISATELATMPAAIATAPSTVIDASESQDSHLTRRARRSSRSRLMVAAGRRATSGAGLAATCATGSSTGGVIPSRPSPSRRGAGRAPRAKSRRVAERLERARDGIELVGRRQGGPDGFGLREIETEKVAGVIAGHRTRRTTHAWTCE
jgi:hypothetical protein